MSPLTSYLLSSSSLSSSSSSSDDGGRRLPRTRLGRLLLRCRPRELGRQEPENNHAGVVRDGSVLLPVSIHDKRGFQEQIADEGVRSTIQYYNCTTDKKGRRKQTWCEYSPTARWTSSIPWSGNSLHLAAAWPPLSEDYQCCGEYFIKKKCNYQYLSIVLISSSPRKFSRAHDVRRQPGDAEKGPYTSHSSF